MWDHRGAPHIGGGRRASEISVLGQQACRKGRWVMVGGAPKTTCRTAGQSVTHPCVPPRHFSSLPDSLLLFSIFLGPSVCWRHFCLSRELQRLRDVSIFQPDTEAGDALGCVGAALQEVTSAAFLKNPGFLGSTSVLGEFLKLHVLLSGKLHKNKMQHVSVFFKIWAG